jgi:hypothetical protein
MEILKKVTRCRKETCNNALVIEESRELGLCSPCRNELYPKHLPLNQWKKYWIAYVEKNYEMD